LRELALVITIRDNRYIPVVEYGAPPPQPPLHKKPIGYVLAIAAGIIAGPAGLVVSPLMLWIFSNGGEKIHKDKNGKEIKVGVWAQWAAAGVVFVPLLWIATAVISPNNPSRKGTDNNASEIDKAFNNGNGDLEETAQLWVNKFELAGRWGCEGAIKENLKDPRSMETRDVSYYAAPNLAAEPPIWRTRVMVVFGARNSFGGMVVGTGRCLFDKNGKLIQFEGLEE